MAGRAGADDSFLCAACGANLPGLLRCGRCKEVYYCNQQCQKQHWKIHRKDCAREKARGPGTDDAQDAQGPTLLPPFQRFEYIPAKSGVNAYVMVFLHGLGDREGQYAKLARKMAIPNCASLAIRAPLPLLDIGFQWYSWFDLATGHPLPPDHPQRIDELPKLRQLLFDRCVAPLTAAGWPTERQLYFGFSQGGTVALDLITHAETRFGGCISISGPAQIGLVDDMYRHSDSRLTPILITHGLHDERIPVGEAQERFASMRRQLASACPNADVDARMQLHTFNKGHIMVSSKEELAPIMAFIARTMDLQQHMRKLASQDPTVVEVTDPSMVQRVLEEQRKNANDTRGE